MKKVEATLNKNIFFSHIHTFTLLCVEFVFFVQCVRLHLVCFSLYNQRRIAPIHLVMKFVFHWFAYPSTTLLFHEKCRQMNGFHTGNKFFCQNNFVFHFEILDKLWFVKVNNLWITYNILDITMFSITKYIAILFSFTDWRYRKRNIDFSSILAYL